MDQADSPQLQGDRSIRFCTRVLLSMRYEWHLRWLVRAGTLLLRAGGEKRARRAGSMLLRLGLLFCWAECGEHLQRGQRWFLESGSAYPSLPFSLQRAFNRTRSPAACPLCSAPSPSPRRGRSGRTGAAVPQGRAQAGAAPVVLLHRPTRGAGSPLLVRSAGCRGSSLASGGSRSSCFRSRYVKQHAAPSRLSLWMALSTRWSWRGYQDLLSFTVIDSFHEASRKGNLAV